MEKLRLILESPSDFEEMSSVLQHNTVIDLAHDILSNLISPDIKNHLIREFLSSWIINRFPEEILGPNHDDCAINSKLLQSSTNLMETCKCQEISIKKFRQCIFDFNIQFSEWKKHDYNELVNNMFFKYHELGVDILNAPDDICKNTFEKCRKGILQEAFKVGGDQLIKEIKSFTPVVIDLENFLDQYNKAFWDLTNDHFDNGNYTEIFMILEHIVELLEKLSPSRKEYFSEIIDIAFIKQQVEHKVFNKGDIEKLCVQLVSITESLQAAVHDPETRKLKKNIEENKIYLPMFLRDIAANLYRTIDEIVSLAK